MSGTRPTTSFGPGVGGPAGLRDLPLIEESDKLGVRSVTAEHRKLEREVFPDLRLEMLHGRMPAREKAERMARFAAGEADILVATSVVEVGSTCPTPP